jgi:dTDP-4-dehydrorhamnose reductase
VKAFVTGADGMLARALVPALEGAGHEVLGLDIADADVTRHDALLHPIRSFQPDWIFHLAAFTKVDECETRADDAHLVNAVGSRNVAMAAAACGASLVAISTDYVFDGQGRSPYREYDPTGPRSVYGASKWAGEQAVREVHPRHMIVRTSWLYGRGGPNFIDTILRKARAGEPLKVVNDQRGSPTYTVDLAAALVRLAATGQYGTYHVTNSGDCTWYDLARFAIESAGLRVSLEPTDSASFARPAPRPAYSVLSNQFYEATTGERMPDWQDAVERFVRIRAAATEAAAGR